MFRAGRGLPLQAGHNNYLGGAWALKSGMKETTTTAQAALLSGDLNVCPIMIPGGTSFDRVGVRCGNSNTGTIRLGLYDSDLYTQRPRNLIRDFGTVTGSDNANVEATITFTVYETGLYWLAVQNEAAGSLNFAGYQSGGLAKIIASTGSNTAYGIEVASQSAGSLVNPFPTTGNTAIVSGPMVYFRVASSQPFRSNLERHRRTQVYWPEVGSDTGWQANLTAGAQQLTLAASELYTSPIFLQTHVHVSQVAFTSRAAGETVTGNATFGLYNSDDKGYPGNLIFKGTAQSLSSGVDNSDSADLWLSPGLYWIALLTDSGVGSGTYGATRVGDCFCQFSVSAPGTGYPDNCLKLTSVSSFPDPFTAGATGQQISIGGWIKYDGVGPGDFPHRNHGIINCHTPYHIFREGWYVAGNMLPYSSGTTKSSLTANHTTRFILDKTISFDQIWIWVAASSTTSGYFQILGYDQDKHDLSTKVIAQSSSITLNATGRQSVSFSITLSPGAYALKWITDSVGSAQGLVGYQMSHRFIGGNTAPDIPEISTIMGLRVSGHGGFK